MTRSTRRVHIIKEIIDRARQKSDITLVEYMNDPEKFEFVRDGIIVEKIKVKKAQSNFKKNYDKVREFFE